MKIALALLLVASTAYADDNDEDVVFAAALAKPDAKYIAGAIAVPFHVQSVPFRSAACKKAFGGNKTVSDAKLLPKLATCLGELVLADPKPKSPPKPLKLDDKVAGETCSSEMIVGDYELWVELAAKGDRPYKISGLRADKLDGELGGVIGDLPPMCTKKAPPLVPQNIAPTMLEGYRKSGNKLIAPDDATKKAIAASGKTKVIGSWKLCVDTDGVVNAGGVLKSTGFPGYDATIEAGIKAWTYRPFLVDGKPVPVCTAVTFIYTP